MTSTEIIIGFVISLVAGYIVLHIPTLKFKSTSNIELDEMPNLILNKTNKNHNEFERETILKHNRKVRDEKIKHFIFYVITFIIISASFFYPMFFHNLLKHTIDLSKTKLGIDLIINKDDLFIMSILYASILYIPILYISAKISNLYKWTQRNYNNYSKIQILIIRAIVTIFFSALSAAVIYYLLNINISLWDAIKFTFLLLAIPFISAFGN